MQYIASKPDKFEVKFWLIVDASRKYLFNGFPYMGQENTAKQKQNVLLPSRVVLKLIEPLRPGHHISMDNFFMSLNLTKQLLNKGCTLLETIRQNRHEIPPLAK